VRAGRVMTVPVESCLYFGAVMHQRLRPRTHRLDYRVFALYVDLDELPALGRALRWFSYNRFNLLSLRARDHGDGSGDLRRWVDGVLADAGVDLRGGRIGLLCYPRLLGYAFNPIAVYFCFDREGALPRCSTRSTTPSGTGTATWRASRPRRHRRCATIAARSCMSRPSSAWTPAIISASARPASG